MSTETPIEASPGILCALCDALPVSEVATIDWASTTPRGTRMTLSTQTRQTNLDNLIRILMVRLGNGSVADRWVTPAADAQLQSIPPTTWDDAAASGLVTTMSGDAPPFYRLTGDGWYRGLELEGNLTSIRAAAETFIRAVKAKANREQDELACIHDFTAQNLPPGFVFNAVDGSLLSRLYGEGRGYELRWSLSADPYNTDAPFFVIPRTFGLSSLRR